MQQSFPFYSFFLRTNYNLHNKGAAKTHRNWVLLSWRTREESEATPVAERWGRKWPKVTSPNLCINCPNFCQTPAQSRLPRAQIKWNKWNRNCSWGWQSFEFEFFKTAYKQKVTNTLWKNIIASQFPECIIHNTQDINQNY